MRKANKKRDQKRSAKTRKQNADKVAATKQKEQYEAGHMRAIERERERNRRHRIARNYHVQAMHAFDVGAALQLAAMETIISDFDDEAARRRTAQELLLKEGW